MTAQDLQAWLLAEGIQSELSILTKATVLSELGNVRSTENTEEDLPAVDWERLLLAGSILARSEKRPQVEAALRIATAAISLNTSNVVKDAGSVLLQKLSNYRAVDLAEQRGLVRPGLQHRLGVSSRVESVTRELEDSVLLEHSGSWLRVNHFQQSFWVEANRDKTWISASAPTASGKTFLVLQWLLNHVQVTSSRVIVYLAPTRALVSEIEESLSSLLRRDQISGIEVSTLPLAEKYSDARAGKSKVIFVFTQERLHLLANALNEDFRVDLLVADEAHKVGDRLRGVVLQDALERVSRLNPAAKLVFISPATQNPETLLEDAPADIQTRAVDSDTPTVLQNLILAKQRPRRTTEWSLTLRTSDASEIPIGTLNLPARPTSLRKKLALIAASAGQKGGTLIYTNGAAEAEEVALLVSQLIDTAASSVDTELSALAELARRGVHESYSLAPLVKKGVAFHYGNMPSLLREEVERLFRAGKIRFLACTSTLIEGVNLSCRTIVVRGPRKGVGQPMEAHDFWNLAGRAGRWGNEFQGNIICVDPDNELAWPNGVPNRQKYPIKRETDSVLGSGLTLRDFILSRKDRDSAELSEVSQLEQVCAYLLTAYLREGSITHAPFAKRYDADFISSINDALRDLAADVTIPSVLAGRHSGVSAYAMHRLLQHFASHEGDVEDFLPAPPESADAYARLSKIMELINGYLYPAFMPHTLIPLHTLVVLEWLKGYSLATIIKARISYHTRHGRTVLLPKLIRETMELVEQIARFRAPKYISAYMDVLKFHLEVIGRTDLITDDFDVAIALEFGVSTKTLLSLMELGLSRMSAVEIHEKIALDGLDRAQAKAWIREHDAEFEGMDLSAIIIREVRRKILGVDESQSTATPEGQQ